MFADTKEAQVRREVRGLADNIYKYLKEFYQYEDEQVDLRVYVITHQHSDNSANAETTKCKATHFEEELQLDDREKLIEKLKYMSIDNCRLREKIAFLRYENEYLKENLDDRTRELKLVKSSESRQREDLAYLKEITKMQKKEIDNLMKCQNDTKNDEHRTSNQLSTDQTKEDRPSNAPASKTSTSNNAGELPVWMQSMRNFFKGTKSAV
ncbi:hypothetical protein PHET_06254 [Paragonimus heterotremus]|uniref:Uncharacterized protein n=1 Tax=Paragonimus heterotremus TaxID=100268 RepID=A0A8J4WGK2_9TREM|nr:hypothetical protein PHET_06254 [Paragonimus heterotremus]